MAKMKKKGFYYYNPVDGDIAIDKKVDSWVSGDNGTISEEENMTLMGVKAHLGGEWRRGRVFLANAFSLQMLADKTASVCTVLGCDPEDVLDCAVSVIGHADTAAVVSDILGREVPCNRANISLEPGDVVYVAQLEGGRLPEGATKLPEGFRISFRKVIVS